MRSVTVLSRRWFHLTLQRTKFLQMGVARKIVLLYNTRTCLRLLSGISCAIFSKNPLLYNGHFSAVFQVSEKKKCPRFRKSGDITICGYWDLREQQAQPLSGHATIWGVSQALYHVVVNSVSRESLLRNMPLIGSTSIMVARAKLTAVPKIRRGVYLPRSRCFHHAAFKI